MLPTTEFASCAREPTCEHIAGSQHADPFHALRYHFGMLLGVDDFETEQAYHRGKHRLHNAWLHRAGAVWGLRVWTPTKLHPSSPPEIGGGTNTEDNGGDENALDEMTGEVRVERGLALDAAGNELHLSGPVCLNVGRWYDENNETVQREETTLPDGQVQVKFDAYVTLQFRTCLSRAVPAMTEPCEGSSADTAFSRVQETVDVSLRGEPPPAPSVLYHRLRLLFGLDDPRLGDNGDPVAADRAVIDERDDIQALPIGQQPRRYLAAFRKFAALDEMELRPLGDDGGEPSRFFPRPKTPQFLLATVSDVTLQKLPDESQWQLVGATVDSTVRQTHVATATIQELLNGPAFHIHEGNPGSGDGGNNNDREGVPLPATDAGGSRIDPATIALPDTETITFTIEPRALKASIEHSASILVSSFDQEDGWVKEKVKSVVYDRAGLVTVSLKDRPTGNLVRLIVRGTGPTPVIRRVGANHVPLAGAIDGPPGGMVEGNDFVHMFKVRS